MFLTLYFSHSSRASTIITIILGLFRSPVNLLKGFKTSLSNYSFKIFSEMLESASMAALMDIFKASSLAIS
jgi:hypothetical protein